MEQKNLVLALVLSMAILIGFQFLYAESEPVVTDADLTEQGLAPAPDGVPGNGVPGPANGVPQVDAGAAGPGAVPGVAPVIVQSRDEVLGVGARVAIETPRVHGSLALTGGRIDDLWLSDYRETLDDDSPEVLLLSPLGAPGAYYVEFGWAPASRGATKVPDAETEWTANRETLTPQNPVTLTWDNGEGLVFTREVAIDDNYVITVNQRVENTGTQTVTLFPYALASRTGMPDTLGFFILHEGPIGVFNETLSEVKYNDLIDDGPITETSTGGWIGISDKYWLVALVPDQRTQFQAGFRHSFAGDDKFQVDYLGNGVTIAPGTIGEVTNRVFAGAKEVETLEAYRAGLGIDRFDLAVDWGWLFFLTKPIFQAIDYLYGLTGNFGVAIIVFTAFVRLLFFPLANKSFRSMGKMRMLQPEMTRLREAYKDDRERMTKETMELYKREGVNPLSGCMPILLQIPVFFALYKVLFVTIEMRHAPFYGWIRDLSAPDPTSFVNLFGLIPFDPPGFLTIGIWPLLMGLTMFLQMKLNPAPPDPIQAKVFMFLPVIFTVILAGFPAGLVIYWTANNALTIAQQWIIMRRAAARTPSTPPART
jgi:YidC/Oxa1 family membrane protein insertase